MMMKRIPIFSFIALLLTFLLPLMLCACEEKTAESGVKTEVYDDSGVLTGYERRFVNSDGLLSRLDVYDENDEYDHFVLYEYDDDGRLIQETTYRADGIGDFYYTYSYDDDDNIVEKGYYTAKDGATRTLYNADGDEIEIYHYNEQDELFLHEIYEDGTWKYYDADGIPVVN